MDEQAPVKLLRRRQRNLMFPGGKYFYVVPETQAYFKHSNEDGLYLLLREHYYANGLDLPKRLMDLVEHYMCLHVDKSVCQGRVDDNTDKRARTLSFEDVKIRSLSYSTTKSPSPDELVKRIKECKDCDRNIRGLCGTCSGLKFHLAAQMRGRIAMDEASLYTCAIDGGFLPVKVYASAESIPVVTDVQHPKGCWAHVPCTEGVAL